MPIGSDDRCTCFGERLGGGETYAAARSSHESNCPF
jgi:hypothetical protein